MCTGIMGGGPVLWQGILLGGWHVHRVCMGCGGVVHVLGGWHVHRVCMGCAQVVHGMCTGCAWDVHRLCTACARRV